VRVFAILALAPLPYLVVEGCGTNNQNVSPYVAAEGGIVGPRPATNKCSGNPALCLSGKVLSGTVALDPRFVGAVRLYRLFPTGGVPSAAPRQTVALDGTWAFSAETGASAGTGLRVWSHYYVQVAVAFNTGDGGARSANAIVGPLTVPSSGAPIVIQIKPVQLELLESRGPGGTLGVDYVIAHVFDPATGDEVSGAVVSIDVGGSSTILPWTTTLPGNAGAGYFATFPSPPAAQPTYTVTTTFADGGAPVSYHLVADPPAFDGTVTATPMSSDGGTSVDVSWSAEPQADYEVVEIYRSEGDGGYNPTPSYISALPDSPGATSETIGAGVLEAGSYLVNVAYAKANCPADAAGCVVAESVAGKPLTIP
jgi:hypothetical protein